MSIVEKKKLPAATAAVIAAIMALTVIALFITACEKLSEMIQAPSYTIIYYGNGGGGYMEKSLHEYGIPRNSNTNAFTRTGYSFSGWAESPSGTVIYTDGQNVKNLTKADGSIITLYAQWNAHSYTVVYNSSGGDGNMENSVHIYDEGKPLNENSFFRTG